jgi:hypothetical protein
MFYIVSLDELLLDKNNNYSCTMGVLAKKGMQVKNN